MLWRMLTAIVMPRYQGDVSRSVCLMRSISPDAMPGCFSNESDMTARSWNLKNDVL